jgi:hypothetical protein
MPRIGERDSGGFAKAGIDYFRIHDLRHFATTVLFMDEIPDGSNQLNYDSAKLIFYIGDLRSEI